MELPGLERLREVCRRLGLHLRTSPPASAPLEAGALVEGLPFDPVLAAVYARFGFAAFATDVAGIVLHPLEDDDRQFEKQNRWWSESTQKQLALPTLVFAGEPHLAYHYATIPGLADEQGWQPVAWVDVYEEPYAIPIASNVDRFFEAGFPPGMRRNHQPRYEAGRANTGRTLRLVHALRRATPVGTQGRSGSHRARITPPPLTPGSSSAGAPPSGTGPGPPGCPPSPASRPPRRCGCRTGTTPPSASSR